MSVIAFRGGKKTERERSELWQKFPSELHQENEINFHQITNVERIYPVKIEENLFKQRCEDHP